MFILRVRAAQDVLYTAGSPGRTSFAELVASQSWAFLGHFPSFSDWCGCLWINGCNGHSAFTRELGSADVKGLVCPDVQDLLTSAVEVICAFGILVLLLQAVSEQTKISPQTHPRSSSQVAKENTFYHSQINNTGCPEKLWIFHSLKC